MFVEVSLQLSKLSKFFFHRCLQSFVSSHLFLLLRYSGSSLLGVGLSYSRRMLSFKLDSQLDAKSFLKII